LGLSAAQCAFDNKLVETLARTVPGIDPSVVLATGVTGIRASFAPDEVTGILLAYLAGLRVVWAMCISFGGCAVLLCFLGPWKRLHKGATAKKNVESSDEKSPDV
jgi:MFS transporter, DHA2 family, glioxin efflux transporter